MLASLMVVEEEDVGAPRLYQCQGVVVTRSGGTPRRLMHPLPPSALASIAPPPATCAAFPVHLTTRQDGTNGCHSRVAAGDHRLES